VLTTEAETGTEGSAEEIEGSAEEIEGSAEEIEGSAEESEKSRRRLPRWTRPSWLHPGSRAAVAAVGLLAVVVFIPAFNAAFVWDDVLIVNLSEFVTGFRDIWFNPRLIESEGHYWPMVYTTFWVEQMLWGTDPVGYHVVNVALHAANAMLVLVLLRRLGAPGAWVAAAIFAVHPTHVDSVAWAIERKDVLSALFYLLAALAYLSWDERTREASSSVGTRGASRHRRRAARRRRSTGRDEAMYAGSLAAFVLALLSKSIAVTLPATLLVYHWWRGGRVRGHEFARSVPFFAAAAVITAGDLVYYRSLERLSLDISLAERAQIVARAFWHYAQQLLWPADLLPIYPRWEIDGGDVLGWALFVLGAGVVVGLWTLRGRVGRAPLAAVLFFGITLSPVLGLVDYGYMRTSYVADRFQYLAGIGFIALVVGSVSWTVSRLEAGHRLRAVGVLSLLCAAALVALGVLTWRLTLNYETPEKFYTYIVTKNPTARGGAYVNLGNAYRGQGRIDDAIEAYEQSLINDAPDVRLTHYNLGTLHHSEGDIDLAESHLRQSLEADPNYTSAISQLSKLLASRQEFDEAEKLALKALSLSPRKAQVLLNASDLYERIGDIEQAEKYLVQALDRRPDDVNWLSNYGLFLYRHGREADAEPVLRRALEAEPGLEGVAQSLAALMLRQGRDDEAARLVEEGYIESLELAAASSDVDRGNDLLEERRFDEAVEAYEAALTANSDNVAAHVQLGVALENLGRGEDALESYRDAYDIDDEDISAVYFRALLLARMERNDEALVLFDEAAELFDQGKVPPASDGAELPDLADVHLNRAVVFVGLDRLDEALADTERALELDPDLELAGVNREQILGMISQRDRPDG